MNKKTKPKKHKQDFINKKAALLPEAKKPLIIAIVSIGAVLILLLLIFFGKGFVGKAYSSIPLSTFSAGSAGAEEAVATPIEEGQRFTVLLGANLGDAESVAFEFELGFDPNKLKISASSGLLDHWGNDFLRVTNPTSGSIRLEHATIDYEKAITGPVRLAEISFEAGQTLTEADLVDVLKFSKITVLDLADQSNIITGSLIQPSGIARCEEAPSCPSCPAPVFEDCRFLCEQNKDLICDVCPEGASADLNGDGVVNDGDIIIIQLAMLAAESGYPNCGANTQDACPFEGVFVCENLLNDYTANFHCGGRS